MYSRRLKYIGISLAVLTGWVCVVIIVSSLSKRDSSNISMVYIWARLSGLVASLGGLVFLVLRIFKLIDRKNNFGYALFGTANIAIGLGGIFFYMARSINMIGLHDLLPNLLIGVVILGDIFLFDALFSNKNSE